MAAALGEKPELKWIRITQLYIDQNYQRSAKSDASRKNLAHIKEKFSWAHCGALIVSYDAERKYYAVIDGQHRLIAALERDDIPELPCVVLKGQEVEEQATSFVAINTKRVILNPLAAFHAAVGAADPDAVSLREILDEAIVDIPAYPIPKGDAHPRQVQAVGTLLKMLGTHSRKQIIWALTIIPEAYADTRGQMRASLIRALADYIKLHPDTDRERMVVALEGVALDQLESDARAYKGIKGGSTTAAMIEVLERAYKSAGRRAVA